MIPKIEMVYSWVYDDTLHTCSFKKYNYKQSTKKYENFIKKLNFPRTRQIQILKRISKYTGLKWKKDIRIYLVTDLIYDSFSDPLTIKICKPNECFYERLIHELCHVILNQNAKIISNKFKKLIDNFKDEDLVTRTHLVVNAVTIRVFTDLFGINKWAPIYNRIKHYDEQKRSYQILERVYDELGENIIKSLGEVKWLK